MSAAPPLRDRGRRSVLLFRQMPDVLALGATVIVHVAVGAQGIQRPWRQMVAVGAGSSWHGEAAYHRRAAHPLPGDDLSKNRVQAAFLEGHDEGGVAPAPESRP
jgi:hypothetical protein